MKSSILFLLTVGALALQLALLPAQDTPQNVPKPPFLAHASHWKINLIYPSGHLSTPAAADASAPENVDTPPPKLNADQPKSIEVITLDGVSTVTCQFDDFPPIQIDAKGPYVFVRGTHGTDVYSGGAQTSVSYFTTAFLFAEWVRSQGLSAFDKFEIYKGVPCFHYQNKIGNTSCGAYDPSIGDEAWISVATMLPVAAKSAGVEADFQFLPAPNSAPELTKDEIKMIQVRENLMKSVNSVR